MDKSRAYADHKYAAAVGSYDTSKTKKWIDRQESWMQRKTELLRTRRLKARSRLHSGTAAYKKGMLQRTRHFRSNIQGFWKQSKVLMDQPVTLTEYSEAAWFDDAGRPLTSQDETGRFVNPWLSQSSDGVHSLTSIVKWRIERLQREWAQHGWDWFRQKVLGLVMPSALPAIPCPTPTAPTPILANFDTTTMDKVRLTWLGHSTCLIQNAEMVILTDPIFSVRSSPFQNLPVGCARQIPPALTIDELPAIDVCLVSHDHYDHLDKPSVFQLADKVGLWVVPSGISAWLQEKCDIPADKVVECEWWESVRVERSPCTGQWQEMERENTVSRPVHPAAAGSTPQPPNSLWLTCCPAQHWASRTYFDRNFRLWCSWAVFFPSRANFYFGGDTALPPQFPLFEQISDYLGPIDLAALPIGAYEPAYFMHASHMDPHEAVFVHKALRVRCSVGIHWGSFDLAEEPMDEPPELLRQAVQEETDQVVDFMAIPNGASIEMRRAPSELEIVKTLPS